VNIEIPDLDNKEILMIFHIVKETMILHWIIVLGKPNGLFIHVVLCLGVACSQFCVIHYSGLSKDSKTVGYKLKLG
jgi:hypothetical protein